MNRRYPDPLDRESPLRLFRTLDSPVRTQTLPTASLSLCVRADYKAPEGRDHSSGTSFLQDRVEGREAGKLQALGVTGCHVCTSPSDLAPGLQCCGPLGWKPPNLFYCNTIKKDKGRKITRSQGISTADEQKHWPSIGWVRSPGWE